MERHPLVKRIPVQVEADFAGWRLDLYLRQKIRRLSREQIQGIIATRLEHGGPGKLKPATRVVAGDAVRAPRATPAPNRRRR